MSWTDDQWAAFAAVLDVGFVAAEPFTEQTERVYRMLLDDQDPGAAFDALKKLVMSGQKFRPAPAEVIARIHQDPGAPTFDEMFTLLFSARGALTARGIDGTRKRLEGMHPLVAAFAERQGIQKLKELPVHDPNDGHWRVTELREAWTAHVAAMAGREVAAMAAGSQRAGLRRLDPLAVLGMGSADALPPGEQP